MDLRHVDIAEQHVLFCDGSLYLARYGRARNSKQVHGEDTWTNHPELDLTQVNSEGKSRLLKLIAGSKMDKGIRYSIRFDGRNRLRFLAHRLVAQYFLNDGIPLDRNQRIGFLDGDKYNPHVDNLTSTGPSLIAHRTDPASNNE